MMETKTTDIAFLTKRLTESELKKSGEVLGLEVDYFIHEKVAEEDEVEHGDSLKNEETVRLIKKDTYANLEKYLDTLKHVPLSTPFIDAFKEMPNFAKYFKELVTKNRALKNEL
ncbi:hypothetical protein HAX54_042442, partial [Datura stramonium]|nr:hypothetical protein [Datura stramonium]